MKRVSNILNMLILENCAKFELDWTNLIFKFHKFFATLIQPKFKGPL